MRPHFPHHGPARQEIGLEGDGAEPCHAAIGIAAMDGQHATGHTNTAAEAASGGRQATHCHVRWSADHHCVPLQAEHREPGVGRWASGLVHDGGR
jgi:hypothetical protein